LIEYWRDIEMWYEPFKIIENDAEW